MLCFVRFRAQGFTRGLRSVIWSFRFEGSRYVVDGSSGSWKQRTGRKQELALMLAGKSGIFCRFVRGSFARRILANDRWTGNRWTGGEAG